jgi:hypothetical protein
MHLFLGAHRYPMQERWRVMYSLRERTVRSTGLSKAQTVKVHLGSWQTTNCSEVRVLLRRLHSAPDDKCTRKQRADGRYIPLPREVVV